MGIKPTYLFKCPDCGATSEQTSRQAMRCPAHWRYGPLMRRVYTAPGLTSAATPTRGRR